MTTRRRSGHATAGGLTAKPAKKAITLGWTASNPAPGGGYRLYSLQSGKLQYRGGVGPATLTWKDTGLTSRVTYTYVATAWNDCSTNGLLDVGIDTESPPSSQASVTAQERARPVGRGSGQPPPLLQHDLEVLAHTGGEPGLADR
jgi:hypothetical protein